MACKVGPGSLSKRAEENVIYNEAWREMREALAKPYNKEINPNGMINISLAENYLMHEELAKYMESNFKVDTFQHFTYGGGSNGSKRLLKAMASFFNSHFHPLQPVDESQFIVTAGVASLIDSITWCLCNDGEGILLPQPLYTGFKIDITLRSRGKILPVSFQFDDREYSTSNVFDPQLNRLAMERALKKYTDEGIKVRAVMIANPHNPLGRCYPEETIKELLRFCNEHDLHYVSDEIYANSVWSNRDYPDATQFKSILAIDTKDIIDPRKMHIMYGMSKDFCANGMRLGILHTRSQAMYEAVSSVNLFSWPPYLTQDIWAAILEDEKFLSSFIDTNNQRLEQAYYGFTSFLDELNIPYMKGGNAGFFLWLHLVRPGNHLTNDSVQVIKDNLIKACYERGVFIRDGNVYFPEEKEDGWVRLTFTLDPDVLKVALERLKAALVAVGLLKEQGLPDGAP